MSKCIEEMILDLKDYKENGTVFRRKAVRGIIRHNANYLVIHGKHGDYKFPGGGYDHIPWIVREIMVMKKLQEIEAANQ